MSLNRCTRSSAADAGGTPTRQRNLFDYQEPIHSWAPPRSALYFRRCIPTSPNRLNANRTNEDGSGT